MKKNRTETSVNYLFTGSLYLSSQSHVYAYIPIYPSIPVKNYVKELTVLLCVGSQYLSVANLASPSLKTKMRSGSHDVTNA